MGRPPKDPETSITERNTVGLHSGEKAFLTAVAEAKGMSFGQLIRGLVYPALESDPVAKRLRRKRDAEWRRESPIKTSANDRTADARSSSARTARRALRRPQRTQRNSVKAKSVA